MRSFSQDENSCARRDWSPYSPLSGTKLHHYTNGSMRLDPSRTMGQGCCLESGGCEFKSHLVQEF